MPLTLDPANANLGRPRGRALLAESLATCGYGRPILTDKHGTVIAGNKTLAEARITGDPETLVVTVTGHELVVVQRTDLDLLTDAKARQLAYFDNRVSELDLAWSPTQMQHDLWTGIDLDVAFFPDELVAFGLQPLDGMDLSSRATDSPHTADASTAFTDDAPPETAAPAPAPASGPGHKSVTQVTLAFETVAQQRRWLLLLGRLALRYPEAHTAAARLAAYLNSPAYGPCSPHSTT